MSKISSLTRSRQEEAKQKSLAFGIQHPGFLAVVTEVNIIRIVSEDSYFGLQ